MISKVIKNSVQITAIRPNGWQMVIEIVEPARDLAEALTMVDGLKLQDGVWGARVIGDGTTKHYRAQAFMDLPDGIDHSLLPDGMTVRLAPPSITRLRNH